MAAKIGLNHLFIDKGSLTGPGYYAVQLAEHMIQTSPENGLFEFKIFAQVGTEHHYSDRAQSHIVFVPTLHGRFARVTWEQLLLPFKSRREKIDLLFSPAFVSPVSGAPVLAAAIPDMYYRTVPDVVERYQRQYWRLMIPVTSRRCELIITISESSRRDIEHYLPAARGKVIVTPLASRFGPDEETRKLPAVPERPFILMVANLTPNKNVTRVVEALALSRDEGRAIDLVHIGVDLRGELARAVAANRLESHVRSLGKVDDDTLIAYARACLCMVVASLYEGFGMPAVEAQALGAPLICSNRSALPEVAGDAALMFDAEDTRGLATCIHRLMDDPDLRAALKIKGRKNALKFSWQRTAELTLNAFKQQLRPTKVQPGSLEGHRGVN